MEANGPQLFFRLACFVAEDKDRLFRGLKIKLDGVGHRKAKSFTVAPWQEEKSGGLVFLDGFTKFFMGIPAKPPIAQDVFRQEIQIGLT
jgi:hypothetical protein